LPQLLQQTCLAVSARVSWHRGQLTDGLIDLSTRNVKSHLRHVVVPFTSNMSSMCFGVLSVSMNPVSSMWPSPSVTFSATSRNCFGWKLPQSCSGSGAKTNIPFCFLFGCFFLCVAAPSRPSGRSLAEGVGSRRSAMAKGGSRWWECHEDMCKAHVK
jgi:hypothetical protein